MYAIPGRVAEPEDIYPQTMGGRSRPTNPPTPLGRMLATKSV